MLKKYQSRFLYEADGKEGGTPPPEPEPKPDDSKVVFTPEQQAAIDKIVGGARTKAREQAKVEFEAAQVLAKDKVDKEAHTKKLEADKEFQKLIDEQKITIGTIEPALESAKGKVTAYVEMAESILTKRIEDLGETAKTAVDKLPGEPDILAKLDWLTANEALFKQKEVAPRGTPPKNGIASNAYQKKADETAPPVVNF